MYATVSYFNYRKDVSYTLHKLFTNEQEAKDHAFSLAQKNKEMSDIEHKIVEGVEDRHVELGNQVIVEYTYDDGYDQMVYSVIELDENEDENEDE